MDKSTHIQTRGPIIGSPYLARGHRLAAALLASSSTQYELAERIGISKQALSDIFRGRSPGEKHLPLFAELLNVPEAWLRDGGPAPKTVEAHLVMDRDESTPIQKYREFMLAGRTAWNEIKHNDPSRFGALLKHVPTNMRESVRVMPHLQCPIPKDVDDIHAAFALIDFTVPQRDRVAFDRGHRQLYKMKEVQQVVREKQEDHITERSASMSMALPMEQFYLIRGALLVLQAERQVFNRSAGDINKTLALIWRRQLAGNWPMQTARKLRDQRLQDLGPNLDQDIDEEALP